MVYLRDFSTQVTLPPGDLSLGDPTPGDLPPGDLSPGELPPGDLSPVDLTSW